MSYPKNSVETAITDEKRAEWREKFTESDRALGFEVSESFQPFSQINDIFTRAFWDPKVKSKDTDGFFDSYRVAPAARRGQGFSQRDFALRNASWIISDLISNRGAEMGLREGFQAAIEADTPIADQAVEVEDVAEQSREIKRIAKLFGADLVGITEVDERWHYASRVDTRDLTSVENKLPSGITHVIVMAHSMDFDLVETYPSALAGASTGRE
ncbi:MAG: epoxyqueuosine reductase, partial [Paracoccaceae bacterium]